MNLYLITRPGKADYDEYIKAVVAAESQAAAANIHPAGRKDWNDERHEWGTWKDEGVWNGTGENGKMTAWSKDAFSTWIPPSEVLVKLLGVAVSTIEQGVISSSNRGA